MSARELTVAHQSPGECAWCDSRHAAIVATVAHELAEAQRAAIPDIMEAWGGSLHQDMLSDLIKVIDPGKPDG